MCHRRANSSCKRSRLSSAVRHRRASNVTLIGVKLPCPSRAGPGVMHVVMLTLGFDWHGFYHGCADEPLAQFLEGHERVVAHCGGHTQQHLNNRLLTVWYSCETERRAWHSHRQSLRGLFGLRAASVSVLSDSGEGQGQLWREISETELSPRTNVRRSSGLPRQAPRLGRDDLAVTGLRADRSARGGWRGGSRPSSKTSPTIRFRSWTDCWPDFR